MSKSSRKTRSEAEHQRGVIRELTKENRALKKQLRYLEKKEHIFSAEDEVQTSQEIDEAADCEDTHNMLGKVPCEECGKGYFQEYHIMDKVIGTCNICGERKRLK